MYTTITHWHWKPGNSTPTPDDSRVWENEPDATLVEELCEVLRCVGPHAVRPMQIFPDDDGQLVHIIGGEEGDGIDVIYLQVTQFPPTIEYL